MRGTYAIARHEFLRRWPLVLVGFGLGLVTLMFDTGPEVTQLANTLATIAIVVCWVIAFTTGLSLIGRPLHDGRLSFYFTRPISSAGIAVGKITGGLVAVTCMHVTLVVPTHVLVNHETVADTDLTTLATFVGVAFFVVGLVVGILARSRSRWFVVDIVGAGVAAIVVVGMFAVLGARKSTIAQLADPDVALVLLHRADTFLYALVVAAAVALVVSVVVGIKRGRTDRDLVHRGLSVTLWPALTLIGLAGIALTQWGLK